MGQVRKPLVPAGPIQAFYDRLHELHATAGHPSMRELQRRTRSSRRPSGINPTTIHDALSAPRLPHWETVKAIVNALEGDPDEFAALWALARNEETALSSPAPQTPSPTVPPAPRRWAEAGDGPPSPPPRELPPDVQPFVGRTREMVELDRMLEGAGALSAIVGTAGVGKTALAVHWAHRVADRFPDGHLYMDLRGFDPDPPVPPRQALAGFLRALGVPDADIPEGVDECAARYRSLLAMRQMLIVLDNVREAEHVRPLLPGSPSCFAVVTSRNRLAGLVARHGARRIDLHRLAPKEAGELTRALVDLGSDGASEGLEVVDTLAERCARLPLALRIAAELAEARTVAGLPDLVRELDDDTHRLDLFDAGGDPRTALREVFSWSYCDLPDDAAQAFRLVSLLDRGEPGGEHGGENGAGIDAEALAALAGTRPVEARRLLDVLSHAHLLERLGSGRFAIHGLLHAYAADLSQHLDSAVDRRAALARLAVHRQTRPPQRMSSRYERQQPVGAL